MTDTSALIIVFSTLFVVIDPPAIAPLFMALTQGMENARRRVIAIRAVATAAILLTIFFFLGEAVLNFIGVTIPAFRIAGGVLLFLTALDMLFQRRQARRKGNAEEGGQEHHDDPSIFPLAIPLIVGPGAITTVILMAAQTTLVADRAAVLGMVYGVLIIVLLTCLAAGPIERALGKVGIDVVTRILGMLLAALAVQFIIDGMRTVGMIA